jgi:tetratricopeptide (TPR) repeat protein
LASIAGAEPDNLVKMREMAERAIQLDPLLEEAHDALGVVYARDGQWSRAEASFRRAIELNPNSELTRVNYVTSLLWPLGRIDEAVQQLRAAERSDPLSPTLHYVYGDVLISAGRFKVAYCWPRGESTMRLRFSHQPRIRGIWAMRMDAPDVAGKLRNWRPFPRARSSRF